MGDKGQTIMNIDDLNSKINYLLYDKGFDFRGVRFKVNELDESRELDIYMQRYKGDGSLVKNKFTKQYNPNYKAEFYVKKIIEKVSEFRSGW